MNALRALTLCCVLLGCAPKNSIDVSDAWVRAPAPGLTVAAGYFDVTNHRTAPIEIVGARSAAADRVELHVMAEEGGMMQMRRIDSIVVPAGQTVSLAPGGTHLMLFGFRGSPPNVPVTLQFADGSRQDVAFELRSVLGASQ